MTETTKTEILNLLHAHIMQRPGLDPRNYGDWAVYRSEARSIARDLREACTLLRDVGARDGITADRLRDAFRAFSGRLFLTERDGRPAIEYCIGQYWPTEYRKAACAVLASALWDYTRDACMPAPVAFRAESYGKWNGNSFEHDRLPVRRSRVDAEADLAAAGGQAWGSVHEYLDAEGTVSPGGWLRRYFRDRYGRGIASCWFN